MCAVRRWLTPRRRACAAAAFPTRCRWTHYTHKKHLSVDTYFRKGEGGRLDIKVEGVLPRPVGQACAALLHPDLYKKWIPGVSESSLCQDLSHFRKLVYLRTLK